MENNIIAFFKKYYILTFILFLWFIFASPYLIKNLAPYSSTYQVNHFTPWSSYPQFWGPVKNGAMPDITDQIIPWKHFTIEELKKGNFALWNPYNFSGNPHLANFQSTVLSPFNLLFLVLPFIDAWSLVILLQPLLAGVFTYLLLREFKASKIAAGISAVSFMFCGFITVWMAYGTLAMAIAFLPLGILGIERTFSKISLGSIFLIALSIMFSFFSGHFQTSLYFFAFLSGFYILRAITEKKMKKTFFILLGFLSGILLSLPQLLPSVEFYLNSSRSGIFINGGGIPLDHLITIFSPDFFGNSVTRNDWVGSYAEWAMFVGIIPLLFAFFALFSKRKSHLVWIFLSLGLLALLFSLQTPLIDFLSGLKLPVLSTSTPSRIIVLFSFAFSVLAGFGFDVFSRAFFEKKHKDVMYPFAIVGLIILFVWVEVLFFGFPGREHTSVAIRNLILPTSLFLATVFVSLILIFVKKKYYQVVFMLILLFVAFDSFRFVQKWMPFDSKEFVFVKLPVIKALKDNIGNGRVFGNLGAQVETYYSIPSLQGYDPLYIERYGEFIRSSVDGTFLNPERSVVKLDKFGKYTDRVINFLGGGLIFHPKADTNQSWAYPVWNKEHKIIYSDDKFELYQNDQAIERAKLYYDYVIVEDKKKIIDNFYSQDFDFENKLILEKDPKIDVEVGAIGEAKIKSYEPNRVLVSVRTNKNALLLLTDNYYPGWKAKVDGKEREIMRADYSFRAVVITSGEHMVEFYYDPASFKYGLGGFAFGVLTLMGVALIMQYASVSRRGSIRLSSTVVKIKNKTKK